MYVGLDAFTAYSLVKTLRKIAQANSAILCTIHQPSSEVFFLFDIIIFMNRGRILYQGPVNDMLVHLSTAGYKCPENYNPADFIMFLTQTESVSDLVAKGVYMPDVAAKLVVGTLALTSKDNIVISTKAGFLTQMNWLLHRECLNTLRNKPALIARFMITAILNLIFGLIFWQAGNQDDNDPNNFQAHVGALTMVFISSMFGTANPTLLEFPSTRPIFMREYSTGHYSPGSYFLSKAFFEIPICFVQALVQFIIVYFMIGFQGNFIYLVLAAWGTGVASSSLGIILGCLVGDVKQASEFGALLFVPQILFAGFFIRTSQIPAWLRWAQYLCSLKYGVNLAYITEFSVRNCSPGAELVCNGVFEKNNIVQDKWWVYMLILFALTIAFRAIGCYILSKKAKKFY